MSEPNMPNITDSLEADIKKQGVSVRGVRDGTIFTFSSELLRALLDRARETGRVILFVHDGPVN